mgnify:CR=1 FL=1
MKIFGIIIETERTRQEREYEKENRFCNGEDGYYGPEKLKLLYDAGINPRCGKKISECDEGMAHSH